MEVLSVREMLGRGEFSKSMLGSLLVSLRRLRYVLKTLRSQALRCFQDAPRPLSRFLISSSRCLRRSS